MNPSEVTRGLTIIKNEFRRILDRNSCDRVLLNAKQEVDDTYEQYQEYIRRTDLTHPIIENGWGFSIDRNEPLKFEVTQINDYRFWVDLSCEFRWKKVNRNESVQSKRNLAVRLWTNDQRLVFRKDWDAARIQDGIQRRVMLRFHFDDAEETQDAPKSHLQVGGVAEVNEYCWLHEKVNQPRLPHPPLDLVLACELIAATLYTSRYRVIMNSGRWKGVVRDSQNTMLLEYYRKCVATIENDQSVLSDFLWPMRRIN